MVTEDALVKLGKEYQKRFSKDTEILVRVERVEKGARDAVVRVGANEIIAVSEDNDRGDLHSLYGKEAELISHGKWNIVSIQGRKHVIDLLEHE